MTISQMLSRMNYFHREVLANASTGTQPGAMNSERIKGYRRAKKTLFTWGALANGPMQRDDNMRTWYPLVLTDVGRYLLDHANRHPD